MVDLEENPLVVADSIIEDSNINPSYFIKTEVRKIYSLLDYATITYYKANVYFRLK